MSAFRYRLAAALAAAELTVRCAQQRLGAAAAALASTRAAELRTPAVSLAPVSAGALADGGAARAQALRRTAAAAALVAVTRADVARARRRRDVLARHRDRSLATFREGAERADEAEIGEQNARAADPSQSVKNLGEPRSGGFRSHRRRV